MKQLRQIALFAFLFGFSPLLVQAEKNTRQVTMALNSTLQQTRQANRSIPKLASLNSDGFKTINGPVDFRFSYGDQQQLHFTKVKLVMFQVKNGRISYIHVFPQNENKTTGDMEQYLRSLEGELVKQSWDKDQTRQSKISHVLQSAGIKDYAHFSYRPEKVLHKVSAYDLSLTAFVDANVRCPDHNTSSSFDKNCKNRFVRIGFNQTR